MIPDLLFLLLLEEVGDILNSLFNSSCLYLTKSRSATHAASLFSDAANVSAVWPASSCTAVTSSLVRCKWSTKANAEVSGLPLIKSKMALSSSS